MAKRIQQESGEERVTAKSRPMMNLIARMPSVVSSAKARPTCLVLRGQCKEGGSSQGSGSSVSTGNACDRKRVSLAAGNQGSSSSNAEVGSSQLYRQDMVYPVAKKLGQKEPDRKAKKTIQAQGNFVAVSPEMENMTFSISPYVGKMFQRIQKKLRYVLRGFLQEQRIDMENVHDIVAESSHAPWARYLGEFGNL